MTRAAGDYHVVGYGENVNVPTIDLISAEKNVIGNLVGSYNDLCDLMALAARGLVTLHTQKYALDDFQSRDLGSRRRPRARSRDPHPLTRSTSMSPGPLLSIVVGAVFGILSQKVGRLIKSSIYACAQTATTPDAIPAT